MKKQIELKINKKHTKDLRENIKKSVCCNANLIDKVQCESCGADGRRFETLDK